MVISYQYPSFAIVFAISAVLCFLSAAMLWRRRVNPGSLPFALMLISLTIWSFASVFEAGAITINNKIFWSQWQYLGITTITPLWIIFTAQYTGRERLFKGFLRWAIWIIPAVTLLLAFTNASHHLIWTDVSVLEDQYYIGYYGHGMAYFIHLAFSYSGLVLGTIWLVLDSTKSGKIKRKQSIIFIISMALVLLANVIYNLRVFPIPGFDLTPVSISIVAVVLAWTISRFHIFDLVPIARDSLLASMQDGVIVLDLNDIILEVNPAALAIAGYTGPSPLGKSIWDVFPNYHEQMKLLVNKTNTMTESELPSGKVVEIRVSPIEAENQELTGLLIILREITERKRFERSEQEQKAFVEVLADTAAVINRTLELDEVLERILENVIKVVPHESANIALMTQKGQAKFVKVHKAEKYGQKDYLTGLDINVLSIKNFRRMAETGRAMIVPDTHADPDWTNALEESRWIRSFLGAPIFYQNELLGFINLAAVQPNTFTQAHAKRLMVFAEYAATAISNARNYAEIKFYADEMTILYEISLAIAAGVGLEKTTEAVFRQLKRVIPIDIFYLALYEPCTQMVSFYMFRGNGKRVETKPFNLFQRPSMTRYVIGKKEKVYIPDFKAKDAELKEHQIIPIADFDVRTALSIPLILRGEVIGVLAVESEKVNAYTDRQIKLVETIAQQATIAMDNAKLFERMQQLAITDGLTNLYNRRYFYMVLENEIERARRYASPLSLVMMDIDHFKRVNDKYGHLAGDDVLEAMAGLCKGLLRQADEMFRYGGEEFTILLPETNAELAMNVAERIRRTIAETVFNTDKEQVKISVSMGVTQFDPSYASPGDFIETADKALYEAKQAGRNCVKVYQK